MSIARLSFCLLLSGYGLVSAKPVNKRQSSASDLSDDYKNVDSALFVAQTIQDGNAAVLCNEPGLSQSLDQGGLDGQYALQLICESSAGVEIFPNVTLAVDVLQGYLSALERALSSPGSAPTYACPVGDSTLSDASLDAATIQNAVCAPPSVVRGPSSYPIVTSVNVTTSRSSSTTLIQYDSQLTSASTSTIASTSSAVSSSSQSSATTPASTSSPSLVPYTSYTQNSSTESGTISSSSSSQSSITASNSTTSAPTLVPYSQTSAIASSSNSTASSMSTSSGGTLTPYSFTTNTSTTMTMVSTSSTVVSPISSGTGTQSSRPSHTLHPYTSPSISTTVSGTPSHSLSGYNYTSPTSFFSTSATGPTNIACRSTGTHYHCIRSTTTTSSSRSSIPSHTLHPYTSHNFTKSRMLLSTGTGTDCSTTPISPITISTSSDITTSTGTGVTSASHITMSTGTVVTTSSSNITTLTGTGVTFSSTGTGVTFSSTGTGVTSSTNVTTSTGTGVTTTTSPSSSIPPHTTCNDTTTTPLLPTYPSHSYSYSYTWTSQLPLSTQPHPHHSHPHSHWTEPYDSTTTTTATIYVTEQTTIIETSDITTAGPIPTYGIPRRPVSSRSEDGSPSYPTQPPFPFFGGWWGELGE